MITIVQASCSDLDETVRKVGGARLDGLGDCVSEEDTRYARRKSHPADRRRVLAGRAALRLVATCHQGGGPRQASALPIRRSCNRCGGNHGKPRLEGMSLSSSTSADRVIAAATAVRQDVGVDLEAFPTALPRGFDSYTLHHQEYGEIGDAAHLNERHVGRPPRWDTRGAQARLERWVLKEAVLKASGLGLEHPPHQLLLGKPEVLTTWNGSAGSCRIAWRSVLESANLAVGGFCCTVPASEGFVAAVAARTPDDIVECS